MFAKVAIPIVIRGALDGDHYSDVKTDTVSVKPRAGSSGGTIQEALKLEDGYVPGYTPLTKKVGHRSSASGRRSASVVANCGFRTRIARFIVSNSSIVIQGPNISSGPEKINVNVAFENDDHTYNDETHPRWREYGRGDYLCRWRDMRYQDPK